MPPLQKALPFLVLLITFSVQGQPPPPGYKYNEVALDNHSGKHDSKELSASKGPSTGKSFSDNTLTESNLDKICKTILSIEDNLKLSNSANAKANANNLVTLLTEDIQSHDTALFEQIKTNAKLICATNNINEQRHYFSLISANVHQLWRIK